jgi:tetratricopeptide (TPR) repeat protein
MTGLHREMFTLIEDGRASEAQERCLTLLMERPLDIPANEMLVQAVKVTKDLEKFRLHARRVLESPGAAPIKVYSVLAGFAQHLLPAPENTSLAADLYGKARSHYRNIPWYYLIVGDLYLYGGDAERALAEYLRGLEEIDPKLFSDDNTSIYRYLLKRVANIYYEKGDLAGACGYFRKFRDLGAYNFFVTDCNRYADCLAEEGKYDEAAALLMDNLKKMPNKGKLRARLQDLLERFGDRLSRKYELPPTTRKPREGIPERVPVKTHVVTEKDDIVDVIGLYVKDVASPGDVIAVAESVAAIAEGRAVSVETIEPSSVATFLSRFVSDKTAPLGSPHGMQVAIDEVGIHRIFLGLFGGVYDKVVCRTAGKFLGALGLKDLAARMKDAQGSFYRIAGAQTALIDDMSGGMPPYDHHVIKGPRNPDGLARLIKKRLGLDACIVDANDMQRAWVVGASDGVDRKYLESVLSDNPAGNEDQQTPIVVVKLSTFRGNAPDR